MSAQNQDLTTMTTPASPLFERPILNSPYEEPTRHRGVTYRRA